MMGLSWKNLGCACLVAAALSIPAAATAGDDKDNKSSDLPGGLAGQKDWKLKAFELKHRNPQEVARIISMRWKIGYGDGGYTSSSSYGTGGKPGTAGAGTGRSQPPSGGFQPTSGDLAVATAPGSKNLFVRGKEDRVEKVEELVKALDVEKADLERKEFGDLTLIPIRQAKAMLASQTLSQLRIDNQVMNLGGDASLLVLSGGKDDDNVKQAREVISKLDADELGTKSGGGDKNDK